MRSIISLKTLIYWCYGIAATLIFSADFVSIVAYQYDVDGSLLENIGLYRELTTLASGLLLAGIVPAAGVKRFLPFSFLLTAIVSGIVFFYPSAVSFFILYLTLGFIFGGLQIGLINELASLNTRQAGLLSDICHLEAVYTAGILVITVASGLLMRHQFLDPIYLYIIAAAVCAGIGTTLLFKQRQFFVNQTVQPAREVIVAGLKALPELFLALGNTLVILALACLGFIVASITYILNWIHFFNTSVLQLSDGLLWEFSIVIAISTISGRLVVAAVVHYLPVLVVLQTLILVSILCIMGFSVSYHQMSVVLNPDTMAELPTSVLFIIVASFSNGGIVPLLTGTVTYHTPPEKRGIILGLITFVMSLATLTGIFAFRWSGKLFTPVVLLAVVAIPLAFVLILSTLFITDLRKSASATA